jgi:VWFA-related protein
VHGRINVGAIKKKVVFFFLSALLALCGFVLTQELQHQVSVINIEVPVRVFKGDHFVNSLSINDFILYEDGRPQKIEAVYLIKKTDVEKVEKREGSAPATRPPDVKKRHFALIFEMDDYVPELNTVVDEFFNKVLAPNDSVWIIMPQSTIHLKQEALSKTPKSEIAEQLKSRLKKAIRWEGGKLRSLLEDLKRLGNDEDLDKLSAYGIAAQIANLKTLDMPTLSKLASSLETLEGQKHVFIFYQREAFRIPRRFLDLFVDTSRKDYIDPEKIRRLFNDTSTVIHFLFITKTQADRDSAPAMADTASGGAVALFEQGSGDFFNAFRDLAVTTGGLTESSANAAFAFKESVEASENYYLLYYKPSDYKPDGQFKKIVVEVKGGGYRVSHRAGYIAK